ncbi:MAG: alanine--glyoxylate aminotransferase family protein [Candidatus Dormibacteraeota bacterium]|nr:alanine--glyoxylate aminotransferase family protein [Candidatus Dormibacteraeota bacterium]
MTEQLRIPGPTPLPEAVVRAMSKPMVDHRGPEFAAAHVEVARGVREVFGTTEAEVLILTSSGTGAMESAVANLVSPGDKVIVCTCGVFGDRFVDINTAFGAEVVKVAAEWGQPTEIALLERTLRENPDAQVVFLTHNETSTGLTNPLQALARAVRDAGRVCVVDAISSASSMPVEMDGWGLDVVLSGSQKGWMSPPGIAFAAVAPRAWEFVEKSSSPRFYFDWRSHRTWATKGFTPSTPAVSTLFAVQEGIRILLEEGLGNAFARHRRIADATAAGLGAAGLQLLARDGYRSATVTAAVVPEGFDVEALRKLMRTKFGVVIAGGRGTAKISERIIRIGHLGAVTEGDMVQVLWALEQALEELDLAPSDGRTLAAARPYLAGAEAVASPH